MTILALCAMALCLLGALALYAASPNQLLLRERLAPKAFAVAGWVLLAVSLVLLLQWAGPATAVFIFLTLAMFVWSVVPPLAAWARGDMKAKGKQS